MKKTFITLFTLAFVLAVTVTAHAQSAPVRTTLSAAMAAGSTNMTVTSATSFATTVGGANAYVLIEKDYRRVTAVNGTVITLAAAGGPLTAHPSGATVVFGPEGNWSPSGGTSRGVFIQSKPTGTCTRASQGYLPLFVIQGGQAVSVADCLGGKWNSDLTLPDQVLTDIRTCNFKFTPTVVSTTGAAGTVYVSSIFVPYTQWRTGLSVLNGGTVGTSLTLVTLYDNAGSLLANASTAGVSGGTASVMWDITFTSARFITGPARYFVGVQNTGATATFGLAASLMSYGDIVGNARAGTFGTLPAITVPTAFTSVQTPVACLY